MAFDSGLSTLTSEPQARMGPCLAARPRAVAGAALRVFSDRLLFAWPRRALPAAAYRPIPLPGWQTLAAWSADTRLSNL